MNCKNKIDKYKNKVFNKITILEDTGRRINNKQPIVKCLCFCGNIYETQLQNIQRGGRGCGCRKSSKIDKYIGKIYNHIEIIGDSNKRNKAGELIVIAKCYCGEIFHVSLPCLKNENNKSCGCLKRKIMTEKRGHLHPNYNHNLSDNERNKKRNQSYIFRNAVFLRDSYTCQKCFKYGGKLCAHHKNGWHWCKEQREDCSNGITFCISCHKQFHQIYGNKNNTSIQTNLYLSETYFPSVYI